MTFRNCKGDSTRWFFFSHLIAQNEKILSPESLRFLFLFLIFFFRFSHEARRELGIEVDGDGTTSSFIQLRRGVDEEVVEPSTPDVHIADTER